MHSREAVLKRSMDFMREKLGWASGGPGVANAQAKLTEDSEVQSVMELLNRANVFGKDRMAQSRGLGLSMGPLTGPAFATNENPFERDFVQSPTTMDPVHQSIASQSKERGRAITGVAGKKGKTPAFSLGSSPESSAVLDEPSSHGLVYSQPVRASLKRTYTDVSALSLHNKLAEVLEQPYIVDAATALSSSSLISPAFPPAAASSFPLSQPHAHGRAGPNSQAIFTTEAEYPWTLTHANDLACLTFGVTKSELRKIGILDVVREDKRKWLEQKLKGARAAAATPKSRAGSPALIPSPATPNSTSASHSHSPARASALGTGVTARLLSKPSSRESGRWKKVQAQPETSLKSPTTATTNGNGNGNNLVATAVAKAAADQQSASEQRPKKSPVLVCGDVVSIRKRNGAFGSATLWVQEKRGGLIWVMEEIAEDVAYLSVDGIGCVTKISGQSEAVWGMERVRRGMDVIRLLPAIPRVKWSNTGALDYDKIAELRRFTARTANDINIPVTVDRLSGEDTFRISSFPYMAGMIILSASTLNILSSNAPISEALFGCVADGKPITEIIPSFEKMLDLLVEEDDVQLVEGMVIPEQNFRRARADIAIREGHPDAAALFLKPSGLPAIHRDGAEIMIDVQMRVVKNNMYVQGPIRSENVTAESKRGQENTPSSELVYALWVTYSRTMHAVNHGIGAPVPPGSRPGTPPLQPMPRHSIVPVHIDDAEYEDLKSRRVSTLTPILEGRATPSTRNPSLISTALSPSSARPSVTPSPHKKSIDDFIILEDMGAGAYGQVKLARPITRPTSSDSPTTPHSATLSPPPPGSSNNGKVVIKYVTKSRILVDTWTRDRRLGTVPLEIHVLDYLRRDGFRHPNIVEMSDFFEDSANYYIEMVPHGLPGMDLFDYIELRVNMGEEECKDIFRQVASAVEFLHVKAKVVHRDIKDENVILDGEGRIKLIDFGSASYIKNGPFDVFVGTIGPSTPSPCLPPSLLFPHTEIETPN